MKAVILILILSVGAYSQTNSLDHKSLYLSITAKDQYRVSDVFKERVKAGLAAVDKTGKLIVEIDDSLNSELVFSLMLELSDEEKKKLLVISNNSSDTPWIRDSSPGWTFNSETGKYSFLVPPTKLKNFADNNASVMNSLLYLCEESQIGPPKIMSEAGYVPQGGDIVSNGNGLCVVGERTISNCDPGSSNEEAHLETLTKDLGCKNIIRFPCDLAQMGHPNGHADLAVSFLSKDQAIVPSVDLNCTNEISNKMRDVFNQLAIKLTASKINVNRIPLALGCINKENSRLKNMTNYNESDFISTEADLKPTMRSFSNVVVMEDSIIVPKYLPPVSLITNQGKPYKDGEPSKDLLKKYDAANSKVILLIEKLQSEGKLAKKKIIQMPITHDNAVNGGAARCLTQTIPVSLSSCTTEKVEQKLLDQVREIEKIQLQCPIESKTSKLCEFAQNIFEVNYHYQQTAVKRLKLVNNEGKKTEIQRSSFEGLTDALYKLKNDLKSFCEKTYESGLFYFSKDDD